MGTPPPIQLANLGMADSLILMVLALVVFGPRRLPQIGRQIGKLMYEFRKASNDFKYQMEEELRNSEDADRRKKEEERLAALALTTPAQPIAALEATVPSSASVMESQYPEQTQFPSLDSTESPFIAPVEGTAEETYPRIQPPSTGEQVPAAKPTACVEQSVAEVPEAESPVAEPTPDTEQAAQHG
jgi:sec-independent protein translocase protein TatB